MNYLIPAIKRILSGLTDIAGGGFATRSVRSLLIFLFVSILTSGELKSQDLDSGYEDVSLLVQIEGYGSFYTNALYSPEGLLYVSIEDLFNYLKIPCHAGEKGDSLSGFLGNQSRDYVVSYKSRTIVVSSRVTYLKKSILKQMGTLYLESSMFGPATGLSLNFNFRNLSATVKSDFELPLIKEQRLDKMRSNIRKIAEDIVPDTTIGREYHAFRFGMADWSISSSQYWGHETESRLGLGLGAELLKGEADLYLNYSDQYKFDHRLQQYSWRWIDNDKKIVSQVQIGKIVPQTISSLYYPVIGAVISNAKTSVRKAMGEYLIKEVTQPDWLVELYINNSLVDFTKADAAGLFMFKVPLVYGYTTLVLKFYGPMGEERSENKTINIPYSFLPSGEIEYKISGGILEDGKKTPFGRGEATIGINRILTMGAGAEYLASVTGRPAMPFVTASFIPFSKLMIFGEFDYGVRLKGLLNYYPGGNSILEIDYTKYVKNQQAILYNYLEERKASFSVPLRVKNVSGYLRAEYKQNIYSNLNYNITELLFSAYYKQFNVNVSTYANWVSGNSAYMNSMLALSYRLKKGWTIRGSAQFNLSGEQILSYKAEAEKRLIHNGFVSVSYEKSTFVNNSSVNLNFKYDLAFAQTSAATRISRHETSTFQSARGSLSFRKGKRQIKATELSTVGRGGITIIPFIDVNHNGLMDKNEPRAANLKVRINGGRIIYSTKDSITSIIGLEPFISYNLELDDKDFENLSWRIKEKKYKVLIDPDQFKIIYVPVIAAGDVSGNVNLEREGQSRGIGRILVDFYNNKGVLVTKTQTESDGYFDYLGLEPGNYTARIDSIQLISLSSEATPAIIHFVIKASAEGDMADNLIFNLSQKENQGISDSAKHEIVPIPSIDSLKIGTDSLKESIGTRKIDSTIFKTNVRKDLNSASISGEPARTDSIADSAIADESHYYVQLGAFRLRSKAEKVYALLSQSTIYPMGIIVEDGYYKVKIGYFRTKKEADECRLMFKNGRMDTFIGQSLYFGYPKNQVLKTGAFYVGVGSFRFKQYALKYAKEVKAQVTSAVGVIEEEGLFKVRLGYFESLAEAKSCLVRVSGAGIKCVIGESNSFIFRGNLIPEIGETSR